ncbi:MAG: polysaccharide lyase [Firmicutes bacterium]|nr:polysaccharide lyase [Bacillota bacterium]
MKKLTAFIIAAAMIMGAGVFANASGGLPLASAADNQLFGLLLGVTENPGGGKTVSMLADNAIQTYETAFGYDSQYLIQGYAGKQFKYMLDGAGRLKLTDPPYIKNVNSSFGFGNEYYLVKSLSVSGGNAVFTADRDFSLPLAASAVFQDMNVTMTSLEPASPKDAVVGIDDGKYGAVLVRYDAAAAAVAEVVYVAAGNSYFTYGPLVAPILGTEINFPIDPPTTYYPINAYDGNIGNYFGLPCTDGPKSIIFKIPDDTPVSRVSIIFHNGTIYYFCFAIETSIDGVTWTPVEIPAKDYAAGPDKAPPPAGYGKTPALTLDYQNFDTGGVTASYVKIIGYGRNTPDQTAAAPAWVSLREVRIYTSNEYVPPMPPLPVPPPDMSPGNVNLTGNWENGTEMWTGELFNDITRQFAFVTAGDGGPVSPRQGSYAARFTVGPNDKWNNASGNRAEFGMWDDYGYETQGDTYYYAWSSLFPEDWTQPNGWGIVMQWHAYTNISPPIAFDARADSMYLNFCTGNVDNTYQSAFQPKYLVLDTLNKGKWNDFIVRITWSEFANGSVTVWHRVEGEADFTPIVYVPDVPTLQWSHGTDIYFADIASGKVVKSADGTYYSKNYVQAGLYRDNANETNVVYQDGFCRGTTYGAVLGELSPPKPVFSVSVKSMAVKIGKPAQVPFVYEGPGNVSFKSSNAAVCAVGADGKLMPMKAGIAVITVSAPGFPNYVFAVTVTA